MIATTVCIGTVLPSPTLISLSTPADGDGISASTLSVEISNSGSSRSTLSPGFFSHLVMVPSKMLSPIWGITMSTAICVSWKTKKPRKGGASPAPTTKISVLRQLPRGVHDLVGVRQEVRLERRRIRHRRIERGHAKYRTIEVAERFLAQNRRDFTGDPACLRVFVHDEHAIRLLHRLQNRLLIEWKQGAQVDHFDLDAFFRERLGRFERIVHHRRVGEDREVFSFAANGGFADRHRVVFRRKLFLDPAVEVLVLEKEHRVIIAYSRFQQAFCVVGS